MGVAATVSCQWHARMRPCVQHATGAFTDVMNVLGTWLTLLVAGPDTPCWLCAVARAATSLDGSNATTPALRHAKQVCTFTDDWSWSQWWHL